MKKIILNEHKLLNLRESIINELNLNPESDLDSSNDVFYFALYKGDIAIYTDDNPLSLKSMLNSHKSELKGYLNDLDMAIENHDIENYTKILGSHFPRLVTGCFYGNTLEITPNSTYNVLNSTELYSLNKMFNLDYVNVYYGSKEIKTSQINRNIEKPKSFYHGTTLKFAEGILKKGLRSNPEKSRWDIKHNDTVFITSSFDIAMEYASIVSGDMPINEKKFYPCVIEFDGDKLDENKFVFDYDTYNSYANERFDNVYNSQMEKNGIDYIDYHKADAIDKKENPAKYTKIGYRGIIYPNAIKSICIDGMHGKEIYTPQEYFNSKYYQIKESRPDGYIGAEGDGGNNEYFHVEQNIEENQELEVSADEVSLDSFKKEDTLAPKIWKGDKLNSKVRLKLLDIADDFWETVNINWVKRKGIILTGSICNYNWSKFSDIDLHIIVDFSEVDERTNFVQEYFNSKKNEWNNEHEGLKIYGFNVEVYVEDINAETESGGLYDLEDNNWIKKPNPNDIHSIAPDSKEIKLKSSKIMTKIDDYVDLMNSTNDDAQLRKLGKKAHKLLNKIKSMRKLGLKRGGETDPYNIIYKVLRRTEYLDKLWGISSKLYDKLNSITESRMINESASVDLSEVGEVEWELSIDQDEYKEYLEENGLENNDKVLATYVKNEFPTFELSYYDNEDYHYCGGDSVYWDDLVDIFGEDWAEKMLSTFMQKGEIDKYDFFSYTGRFETCEMYEDSPIDINNPYELNYRALQLFRHGGYFKGCRGFILSDGSIIYTEGEHNEVTRINGIDDKFQFIKLGNIRIMPNSIDIGREPTYEQKEVLRKVIASYSDEELYMDVYNEKVGDAGVKYVCPDWRYVIGEIDRFYDKGIKPMGRNVYENKGYVFEEVVADGNSEHNPYIKKWKHQKGILRDYIIQTGEIMQSMENGKFYKVLYDKDLSVYLGVEYAYCIQYDPNDLKPIGAIYIRPLSSFTYVVQNIEYDTRGHDNIEGTSDDIE